MQFCSTLKSEEKKKKDLLLLSLTPIASKRLRVQHPKSTFWDFTKYPKAKRKSALVKLRTVPSVFAIDGNCAPASLTLFNFSIYIFFCCVPDSKGASTGSDALLGFARQTVEAKTNDGS